MCRGSYGIQQCGGDWEDCISSMHCVVENHSLLQCETVSLKYHKSAFQEQVLGHLHPLRTFVGVPLSEDHLPDAMQICTLHLHVTNLQTSCVVHIHKQSTLVICIPVFL